jgi:carboxypeptidase family protein
MRRPIEILFAIVLITCLVQSQTTTGNLGGRILNSQDVPIPGVNVICTSPDLMGMRGSTCDGTGRFYLGSLPPGLYNINISHVAYQGIELRRISILLGETTSLGDIHLAERAVEYGEITVTGNRPVIDLASSQVGETVTADQISALPLERNYQAASLLLPHSNASPYGDPINSAGATGLENRYFVDGVEVSDPTLGLTNMMLPQDFVREMQVRVGGYEAEYKTSLGGMVNAITYSGRNKIFGKAFSFFTNNNFSGSPRYAPDTPPRGGFSEYDMGISLGGPLLRDRLWYSLAYNPKIVTEDVAVLGEPNQTDKTTTHMFATKICWQPVESQLFELSVLGDPSIRSAVDPDISQAFGTGFTVENLDAWLVNIKSGGIAAIVQGTHLLSDRISIRSFVSVRERTYSYQPISSAGGAYSFVDMVSSTISGGLWEKLEIPTSSLALGATGQFTMGPHEFKAGVEYEEVRANENSLSQYIMKYSDTLFVMVSNVFKGTYKHINPSTFVQDGWQATDRVRVNLGIRWDPQIMIASDGSTAQRITTPLEPRLGIILAIGESGTEKISASAGRFVQPILLDLSGFYHNRGVVYGVGDYPHDPRVDTTGGRKFASSLFLANVPDLSGQYYDECTLGYERSVANGFRIGIRGMLRLFRQGVEDGLDPTTGAFVYGNPGTGSMSAYPELDRKYMALELSLEKSSSGGFSFITSYVLSRNYGNYTGLAMTDGALQVAPNVSQQLDTPENTLNGTGLLPNDRTHVLKGACSYLFENGLAVGGVFQWMSGTPLNEFGGSPIGPPYVTFLVPRGTVGRTPDVWDLSLRLSYQIADVPSPGFRPRLILDLFHVASQRTAIQYDQIHYFALDQDGKQTDPDPNYLQPIQFQPPMSVRLGIEVNF